MNRTIAILSLTGTVLTAGLSFAADETKPAEKPAAKPAAATASAKHSKPAVKHTKKAGKKADVAPSAHADKKAAPK